MIRARRPAALAAALVMVLTASLVLLAPHVRAGAAIVFSEDFEGGVIGSQWSVADTNAASGPDYWGITDFRAHGGNYSLWSAQVGNQSSGSFVGMNNSDPGVQLYDDNMDSELVINLRVSGFNGLTLSFFVYSRTENGGGDWIQVWIGAGANLTNIYDNRGTANWDNVTTAVPPDIDRLIFRFHTDSANHGFEGAYVDDIVLVGTEDIAPSSSVSTLPTYSNDAPYLVPYTAQDNVNASGVDYVELWYRMGTYGNFTLYTTASNPLGHWIGPTVPFDASSAGGDGYYELYTIAVDRAGNPEGPPSAPDASVTIDTAVPTLSITAPSSGASLSDGPVTVEWQGSDALSGIDYYEVILDGGAPQSTGTTSSITLSGLAPGDHTVTVRAYDRAGNVRELSVTFSVSGFPWWILLVIIAIVLGVALLFLWWRRREKKEEETLTESGAEPTTPEEAVSEGPEALGSAGPSSAGSPVDSQEVGPSDES